MKPKEIIKKAREAKGLTQEAFAASIGLSPRTYQRYEEGVFPKYRTDTVRLVDKNLGTNIYDILYANKVQENPQDNGAKAKEVHPPAFVPVPWQDYVQLIHASLEALRIGQSQILNQQARTIAEVRGYGQYQIQREVNWNQEEFLKLMERVGMIIGANLKVDDEQGNPSGS